MKEFVVDNIGYIIIGILSLIEIVPIKVSPLEWVGKRMTKQLDEKVENIDKKMDTNHQEICKILISNFVQDYLNGESKTKSQWIAIRNLADEYITKGWNSEIRADAIFLEKEYEKLFLNGKKES